MTAIHDLVLVHIDNKPGFFARVEDISVDVKPGWWQVKLLVLTLPMQVYTWVLDESQINGAHFTMGGTPILLEKVVSPLIKDEKAEAAPARRETGPEGPKKASVKVVRLSDRKKDA